MSTGTGTQLKPLVMVVDDDLLATKAVVMLLQRHGYEMVSASSGPECLKMLAEGAQPDVLVLDVKMPEMSGLDVCRTVKSDGRFRDMPIILLTGCDDLETRAAGMKLGVSEFLCKPFAHHELLARIGAQLDARRIGRELDTIAGRL
jgi:DNA-binding response OmpR family regulator